MALKKYIVEVTVTKRYEVIAGDDVEKSRDYVLDVAEEKLHDDVSECEVLVNSQRHATIVEVVDLSDEEKVEYEEG